MSSLIRERKNMYLPESSDTGDQSIRLPSSARSTSDHPGSLDTDSLHEELEVQPDDDLHGQDETKPKTLPGEPSLPAKFVNSNGTTLQYTSTGQYLEKWGKSKLHTKEELQFHYTDTNQYLPKRENSQPQTPGSIKMYSEKEYSTETLNSIPGTVDNNDQQNGQEDLSGNEGTETYEDVEKKPSHERKRILTVLIIFLCIAGMVAWISLRNTSGNSDNIQPTSRALVGNCSGYNDVGNIGKEICLAPKPSCFAFVRTGTLRNITIKQISSTYNNFETTILLNIVIPESRFNTEFNGWIVDYNISRLEQPLRIGKPNLTCGDIGECNVTLHYEDIQDEFCQFGINNAYPQLNISFTETDKYVIVTCKLSGSCLDAFLALYINDDNNTIPIRTDKQTGCGGDATTMTRHVALQKSMIYSNASITCKPLTDNDELTENLTTTTTVCQGRECYKTCIEEQKGFYYQDPVFCDKYYQCEYPALHLRPCPELQFWNPKMCTCDHRRSDALQQCNTTTNRYDPQIRRENIQSCGGPS